MSVIVRFRSRRFYPLGYFHTNIGLSKKKKTIFILIIVKFLNILKNQEFHRFLREIFNILKDLGKRFSGRRISVDSDALEISFDEKN
jgi:hypothetical protein